MKLLIATQNRGKLDEITRLLVPAGLTPVALLESGLFGEMPETGSTYLENAAAKALFWSRQYEGPVLAEDSGLEVEALGGKPGVHTARYGGPGLTDAQRCQKLLEELAAALSPAGAGGAAATGAAASAAAATAAAAAAATAATAGGSPANRPAGSGRVAAYRCVAALANGGNLIASFAGTCQGEIAPAPRGTGGFGYDPIFLFPSLAKTFAELPPAEKDRVSHRGVALRALAEHVKAHGLST
jgi:XTP/dITP diphosphohydrolase